MSLIVSLHDGKLEFSPPMFLDLNGKNALDLLLIFLWEELQRVDSNIQVIEENLEDLSSLVFAPRKTGEQEEMIIGIGHNSDLIMRIQHQLKNFSNRIHLFENEWEAW
eukprot:CAMPEP_0168552478 /NCGR_PEP_ID=MMETSP0413-20121227/6735_1 /TAXON_ID=136452 /ORGANISM="Filamoeba nolandi, Strain NC-AS-23-1" /LENGTH=107 /DNA_ID=CAMNT_0008583089 /DNA_START=196 /DNA_END=516 /DNA_ORIENTATION=-